LVLEAKINFQKGRRPKGLFQNEHRAFQIFTASAVPKAKKEEKSLKKHQNVDKRAEKECPKPVFSSNIL